MPEGKVASTVLPADFDGVFRFTNWTDEDFTDKWNGKAYTFPSLKTSPMIIPEESPLGIQQIRKKFAKSLAEREFFKSKKGISLTNQEKNSDGTPRFNSLHMAATYSDTDLAPFIQKCLEPLPVGTVGVSNVPKIDIEANLSRDEEGQIRTKPITQKVSLKKQALES